MGIEELNEVKATGENSSTADPVVPAGGDPKGKNRKADMRKDVDKNADEIEDDVKTPMGGPSADKESAASGPGKGKKAPARLADKKMKESVEEMFEGQDLSEEFKEKATVVFEAAIAAKMLEEKEILEEEFEKRLEEEAARIEETLSETIDKYLSYAAEEWLKENELAIETGLRTEIAESFMDGLMTLFKEHNFDIDDEKVDLVAGMQEHVDETDEKLNEALAENIELKNQIENYTKRDVMITVSEGLTDTQVEKLATLSEGIEFTDEESYTKKIEIIKENYFGKKTLKESAEETGPVDLEEETTTNPTMSAYVNSISKGIKK